MTNKLLPAHCPHHVTEGYDRAGVQLVANDLLDAFTHIKRIDRISRRDRDNLEGLATLVMHRIRVLSTTTTNK